MSPHRTARLLAITDRVAERLGLEEAPKVHPLPEGATPFGEGRSFVVVIPADVTTYHGNVAVPAGVYEAQESKRDAWTAEGTITVWTDDHYAARDGIYVSVTAQDWHFPGEEPRPIPAHNCADHLRSATVGPDIYCGVCMQAAL